SLLDVAKYHDFHAAFSFVKKGFDLVRYLILGQRTADDSTNVVKRGHDDSGILPAKARHINFFIIFFFICRGNNDKRPKTKVYVFFDRKSLRNYSFKIVIVYGCETNFVQAAFELDRRGKLTHHPLYFGIDLVPGWSRPRNTFGLE